MNSHKKKYYVRDRDRDRDRDRGRHGHYKLMISPIALRSGILLYSSRAISEYAFA